MLSPDQTIKPSSNGTAPSTHEPIAIVGMACRFPGADDVEAFWRLLMAGENAVIEGEPGSGVGRIGNLFPNADVQSDACRFGGYLDEVDQFDASFFRISPIEAQFLDPQQRLMLETSWQALEDAAIDPERLIESRTGVYGGISTNDYRGMIMESSDSSEPAASLYTVSGTSYNTAIGRVAYALGFRGPAIAIDTACSSSLVAVHQAVSGLQRGESDLALAGGVHAILSGRLLELRGNAGMLSPDGRCKTFDASANGYVRGEGCGILVLKRLSDAEADGDRIWAVIRGSALNQDGASQGLTVPDADAQRQVIEDALVRSGVLASEVDYVEAHGTGTPVGDPIEMEALQAAYGTDRDPGNPLLVGSVKTNFGHLEAAAGVAGLMKTILAIKHGVIPKHLNFKTPNPDIDWDNLPISITADQTEWPAFDEKPPLAGVSGFGWSGTNAHVILEGYGQEDVSPNNGVRLHPNPGAAKQIDSYAPRKARDDVPLLERKERVLTLSGKTVDALKDLATKYQSWLDVKIADNESPSYLHLADMAWTAGIGRSHFACRAGVTFSDIESLGQGLKQLTETEDIKPTSSTPKVAYVYTGQGSQWSGMGQTLYMREPVVRAVLDRCEAVILDERGVSLLDIMFGKPDAKGDLHDTAWTQPAVYALECALTALWVSLGVKPDVVIGHSLGEFAAAYAAGIFELEDGLRFVAKRGELLSSVPELGGMAAIFASQAEVSSAVRKHNDKTGSSNLCVAVDNGVHQVVSGPLADVEAISQTFEAKDVRVRLLRNQAFHSPLVEPALDELEAAYSTVNFSDPNLALISNVTGTVIGSDEKLDGDYWRRHARNSVQFKRGIESMVDMDIDLVIEVGPNAVLGPLVSMNWPERKSTGEIASEPNVLSTLLRNYENLPFEQYDDGFVTAVAKAYEAGIDINIEGLFAGESRRRIAIPSYAFQRERYWVEAPRRKRASSDHPLLGAKQESARGEVIFETEVFPTDPTWLDDHRVYGRVVMPGAVYGAMAASVLQSEGADAVEVNELQLHTAMVFPEDGPDSDSEESGRRVQLVLDKADDDSPRHFEIFSKSESEDEWTLHAEGLLPQNTNITRSSEPTNLSALKSRLQPQDTGEFYRQKADSGINFGTTFKSVDALWAGDGESIGEVVLNDSLQDSALEAHPVLIDGCFQVLSAARESNLSTDGTTYLPFAWERMWFTKPLPPKVVCHARINDRASLNENTDDLDSVPEALTGQIHIYTPEGEQIGGIDGFAVKRATRESLIPASDDIDDLLYEVVWREQPLATATKPADFLVSPEATFAAARPFTGYLADQNVDADSRAELLNDLERLSWAYALATLDKLGWERIKGEAIDTEHLREQLNVLPEHSRLFRRLFELLARAGVVEPSGDGFVVLIGQEDSLPELMPDDGDEFAVEMLRRYEHGSTEVGLFRRCASALADTVRGEADALTLLFSSGEPTAADLYISAPGSHASNRMLGDAVASMLTELPEGRRLRILEVGAGTGSATASVLPNLPDGRFDYVYTDISAGFFAEAESKFGGAEESIEYRVLDIERSPIRQGFDAHSYDMLIASNVLHATRYLKETLENCLELLAPSGILVALENLRGQGWMDLTFGVLDGWWRFADDIRPHHALAGPDVWKQALEDAGFVEASVLGPDVSDTGHQPDRGVIMAQGPYEVSESPGIWILASDRSGVAENLAAELASKNQTVLLAGESVVPDIAIDDEISGLIEVSVKLDNRESWRSLLSGLPEGSTLNGIVHLVGFDGHGADASTTEFGEDAKRICSSALTIVQGAIDADVSPVNGVWFLTRGAQVLEREHSGEIAGAVLWGVGKVVDREAPQLQPRMIDLDPDDQVSVTEMVDELLHPDDETHIAYRHERRQVARLERTGTADSRLTLPDDAPWIMLPDENGDIERQRVEALSTHPLASREVRVAVDAVGINFRDMMVAMGMLDDVLGGEVAGRVIEVGPDVTDLSEGDLVAGLCFRSFASEVVTRAELLAPAPPGYSASALATIPLTFTTVELSFEIAKLKSGDRILIHSGAGGVGLSAIQMAHATGAEVFATASKRKHEFLRSIGVKHVFDSRQTHFGSEILEATNGDGVDVVLNSLTGEGYIDASLSCLAVGGRWVELAAADILSEAEMAAVRPDVEYSILALDALKTHDPVRAGKALRNVMERVSAGELHPILHSRWPLAEAGHAMQHMRSARHIGKLVLTKSPMQSGGLRADRTYLVTGGLGGIGIALAEWLTDQGAGCIVLNGRRDPDPDAVEAIDALRNRGAKIEVELADVTDTTAIDAMLARMDENLPPLAGVIHSVGVLSDAALTNQTWESFEQVLWPKVFGAWHLHRATMNRDLELFIMFSSVAGVLGNAGQANHAAANAFLDQLAGHRRALGLPGQTIAWGAWSELGEAAEQRERIASQLEAVGTGWMTPRQGITAFEHLIRQDTTNSLVASVDWPTFANAHEGSAPLLDELLSVSDDDESADDGSTETLLERLRGNQATDWEEIFVEFLQEEIQAVMRLQSAPSPTIGFFDLGMDSLMAVELRNRLNRAFDGEYVASNTIVFDYPTVSDLARHLVEDIGDVGEEKQVFALPVASVAEAPASTEESLSSDLDGIAIVGDGIAIVGMACRFPGARNLDQYWRLLDLGSDAIADGRHNNGSWKGVVGDPDLERGVLRKGAFVDEIDLFDSRFFRISPIEARTMDPQQRMLLETTWHAIEDAGIDPDDLRGSRTGVYVGIGASEYRDVVSANGVPDNYLGTTSSMAVGRIAFALGLEGPAIPIDLVCASSHASVHQAVKSLENVEVDMALAGGVNAVLSEPLTEFMTDLGMLSSSGESRPFDAGADGFVRGEGCGMLVLKRLSDAEADGDRIWGVILGSAINQNGASAGVTVPNGPAQQRVMQDALSSAGIDAGAVDYYEAHGGASQLGDPIELHAASAVYGEQRTPDKPLYVGSVKANVGHLETAAGVASLIKVVLSMKNGVVPKQLNFDEPNPHVDWDRIAIQIPTENMEWPNSNGREPLAAISGFAMSGANAHIVLSGYGTDTDDRYASNGYIAPSGLTRSIKGNLPNGEIDLSENDNQPRQSRLLPLSGKSEPALRDLAKEYLGWLDQRSLHGQTITDEMLSDMAWTASVGRSHFAHRRGVVFQDINSLKDGLDVIANIDADPETPEPVAASKVAFVYADEIGYRPDVVRELYESEPVFRSVIDRCDGTLGGEQGIRLLDVMLGRAELDNSATDLEWVRQATFAFQCALTALWTNAGVTPNVVLARGIGELAAAEAASEVSLEDGLRIAEQGGQSTQDDLAKIVESLSKESEYFLIGIGESFKYDLHPAIEGTASFVDGLARAYEAGVPVSFEGLFAGESRRRIAIPSYPFQRRRHWA